MSSEKSVHSANIAEIYVMPISEIIRPIPSVLDDKKVDSLVETLKVNFVCRKLKWFALG
jgi:sulfiredoxin